MRMPFLEVVDSAVQAGFETVLFSSIENKPADAPHNALFVVWEEG
jgi:hypothetical protein